MKFREMLTPLSPGTPQVMKIFYTLMGVTKRDPRILESVTWLSSTDVMISSAPVMMAMSRLECADNWKSV